MSMRVDTEATEKITEEIEDKLDGESVQNLLKEFFLKEAWKANVGDLQKSTFDSSSNDGKGKMVIIKNKVLSGEYTTPSLIIGLTSAVRDPELFDSINQWLKVGQRNPQIFF